MTNGLVGKLRESESGYKKTSSRPISTSACHPTSDIRVAVTDFRV